MCTHAFNNVWQEHVYKGEITYNIILWGQRTILTWTFDLARDENARQCQMNMLMIFIRGYSYT